MNRTKLISLLALPATMLVAQTKQPNVIIINADDLGYGDVSCNGATVVATPNVDRIANEGIRLTNFHTTSATSTPSRFSLLTGKYAWRVKGTGVAPGDAAMIVTPQMKSLPQMFERAGYNTGAVGKWHLGLGSERGKQDWNGLITPGLKDIGFGYSYIMAATGDRVPCVYIENGRVDNLDPNDPISVSYSKPFEGEPTGRKNPEMLKLHPSHGHDQALINGISRIGYMKGGKSALWVDEEIADVITDKAVKFIENNSEHPFFLYFATNDIHVPRAPHARFVGKSGMGARGDAILSFDWSVGEILRVLDEKGIADNTIVLITSDNGPVIDDGYLDKAWEKLGHHQPWGEFRGGKYSSFEAGTRVLGAVRWPGKVKANSQTNALLSQIDLFATFANVLDHQLQDNEAPDSQDQLKAFTGKDKKGREYLIEDAYTRTITIGDWKYIRPSKGAYRSNNFVRTELGNLNKPQLYNLKSDPSERYNLADKHPKKVVEMEAKLKAVENEI